MGRKVEGAAKETAAEGSGTGEGKMAARES